MIKNAKTCGNCRHWTRGKEDKTNILHYFGSCKLILNDDEVTVHHARIMSLTNNKADIKTNEHFFCNMFMHNAEAE